MYTLFVFFIAKQELEKIMYWGIILDLLHYHYVTSL